MEIKIGDYLLTPEKELFRVVDQHVDGFGTYYDIKSLKTTEIVEISSSYPHMYIPKTLRSVPKNVLKHMGKIIPEEKISKTLKILYG